MKFLFLDIDGVLNNFETSESSTEGAVGIDNDLIKNLKKVIVNTNAKIILTSTWRFDWEKDVKNCDIDGIYLNKKLESFDLSIEDKVLGRKDNEFRRGRNIRDFLDKYPSSSFAIVDDFDFDFADFPEFRKHIVLTNPKFGLTEEDANNLISILMGD